MPSFSLLASDTGNDTSIEIPGAIQAGDLCFIWNVADGGGSNPADATPDGFTQLRSVNTNNRWAKIFAKILSLPLT